MTAEQYFNSLTPQQQEAARASGAYPGGPNFDAWFANAQAAGAVGAPNNPGGGGGGAAQGESGGGNQAGKITAADVRANAKKYGLPEDYARFSDAELNDWLRRWNYDPNTGKFTNKYGDQVDKPDERGPNTPAGMNGTGDPGNYGGGRGGPGGGGYGGWGPGGGGPGGGWGPGGGYGGAGRTYGGAPQFQFGDFQAPSYQQAAQDPGYQFALSEGLKAIEGSAAAKGIVRSGGVPKSLGQYATGLAAGQYGDVFNRALQGYGANFGTAQARFAPRYGSWGTVYQGNLQQNMQREQNIYNLLNQPPPMYPGY